MTVRIGEGVGLGLHDRDRHRPRHDDLVRRL